MGDRYWKTEMLIVSLHNMDSHTVSGKHSGFKSIFRCFFYPFAFYFMPLSDIVLQCDPCYVFMSVSVEQNI